MSKPSFDKHQFAGSRRDRAVTKTSGIAWTDYLNRMHKVGFKRARTVIPLFALNEKKLAAVLKQVAWKYVHTATKKLCPEEITLEEIKRQANAKHIATVKQGIREHLSEYQKQLVAEHARCVEKAGGYLELHASLAWKAWRQGMNSVEISRDTGVSPWHVRQRLSRMNRIARQLFPEDALPFNEAKQKSAKAMKAKRGDPNPKVQIETVNELLQSGQTPKELAALFGCTQQTIGWYKREHRRKNGGAILPVGAPRKYDPIEIRELREHFGLKWKDIAGLIGAPSEQVVCSLYHRNRLKDSQEHQNETHCEAGKTVRAIAAPCEPQEEQRHAAVLHVA